MRSLSVVIFSAARTGVALGSVAAASLLGQLATSAALFADGGGLTSRTLPLPLPAKAIIHIFFSAHSAHSAVNRSSDIRDRVTIACDYWLV